jgi:cell division protein FtsB
MDNTLVKYWKIIRRYTNKYQIVFAIFLIVILFIDEHNVFRRIGYHRKINDLKKEIRYYESEKEKNEEKLKELQSNDEDLEKFAREEYLMKKENEDIFMIK